MVKESNLILVIAGLFYYNIASTDASIELSDSANCFSLEFYKKLALDGNDNLISSPFSVDVVMSMMLAGAGGTTADQLRTALKYDTASMSDILNAFKSDLGQINKGDGNNTLTIANSMWIQKDFNVPKSYQQIVQTDFYAVVKNLDFGNHPDEATKEINDWGNSQTHGLIPKLYDKDLPSSTVIDLVNAVYFKGKWASPFNPNHTKPDTFHTEDNSNPKVPLMHLQATFGYLKTPNAEILEMDYVGGKISMKLILPTEGTKIADYEISLSCNDLPNLINYGPEMLVNVTMPKFEIHSVFADLAPPLKQSGIVQLFTPSADLSGISPGIYVSGVLQKAAVKVYEEGSEAAAETGVGFAGAEEPPEFEPPTPEFKADRPFLFLILHKPTNLILFMGRVKILP